MRTLSNHLWALWLGGALALELGGAQAAGEVTGPVTPIPVKSPANPQTANTAPSFIVGGKVTTAFGAGSAEARSVVVQPDGKIVTGGWASSGSGNVFALSRYLANGRLDTGFGAGGRVTTDLAGCGAAYGYSLALQTDGKLVLTGEGCGRVNVARYLADGSLDAGFGSTGQVSHDLGFDFDGKSIAIQPDGKLLIAGDAQPSASRDFGLVRLLVNGSLDISFGVGGYVTTDSGSPEDRPHTVLVQPDGKIVVTGQSAGGFTAVRYLTHGALDTDFGTDGLAVTFTNPGSEYDNGGYGGALQADGKILIAGTIQTTTSWGSSRATMAVVRYLANGTLDMGFGAAGQVVFNVSGWSWDEGRTVIQHQDGKITAAGHSDGNFSALRLLADGDLDVGFGNGGLVQTDFGSNDVAHGLAPQADGRLLAVGTDTSAFALARYYADGALDTSFGEPVDSLAYPRGIYEQGSDLLSPLALVLDAELAAAGTYDGATLTLRRQGGANAEDEFASAGNGLTNLLSGSYFAVDSVSIGQVVTNNAGTLQLRFLGANATQARVDKTLQLIAYRNSSDRPPAQVLIDWTFDDGNTGSQGTGGALSTTGMVTVTITPENDWPHLINPPPTQTAVVGSAFSYTLPANSFNDPDGDSLTWSLAMADSAELPTWLSFNPVTRVLSGTPTASDVGPLNLRVTVTDPYAADNTADFTVHVRAGLLSGLAAQGYVGTGNQVQFGAFTIAGDSRRVLIRGLGPTLSQFVPGALANPRIALSLNGAPSPLVTNDDWKQAENAAEIESLNHQPVHAVESAILTTLQPGVYNLHLSGSGGSTGIGMFQVYGIEGGGNGELKGLAAQGQVGTGNQVQFGAFTIIGSPQRVLIRGLGPALNGYVPGPLENPQIALSLNGAPTPLEVNDDWADADNADEIAALKHQPKNPTESAILRTLEPGVYNVHLSGSGGTEGIGMFQVYTVE